MRWTLAGLVAVAAVVVGVAGASGSTASKAAAAKSPFTVVMAADLSGPTKAYGAVDVASMRASAKYWNQRGGIDGHPITITVLNDNGDPTTGATVLAGYLSSHPKPSMLWPGTTGLDSAGMFAFSKRDHILAMAEDDDNQPCATEAATVCPWFFTVDPPVGVQEAPIAPYFKAHGFKHVGILEEEDAFSVSETAPLQAELTAAGIQSTVVTFPPTAVSVQPEFQELQSDGVDVIYTEALAAAPGYVASARSAAGDTQTMPLVFDLGAASEDLTTVIPAAQLQNTYEAIAKNSDPYLKLPGRTALIKYGGSAVTAQPLIVATFEWQDLLLMHEAAAQAHSITVDALSNALQNLPKAVQDNPLNTVAPGVAFTRKNHENSSPLAAHAYEVVPVGPLKNGQIYYKQ
jgi:hypothetical protein